MENKFVDKILHQSVSVGHVTPWLGLPYGGSREHSLPIFTTAGPRARPLIIGKMARIYCEKLRKASN